MSPTLVVPLPPCSSGFGLAPHAVVGGLQPPPQRANKKKGRPRETGLHLSHGFGQVVDGAATTLHWVVEKRRKENETTTTTTCAEYSLMADVSAV